ncbi:MAG: prepilin-type N-terminal cleavage/methylation domain-containing protein [Verrucomicrobiae bacterium]
MPKNPNNSIRVCLPAASHSAFTFVELLVALSIAATVLVVAVMAYSAIGNSSPSRRSANVQLSLSNMVNFYPGSSGTTVSVSEAPSMAATAMANSMRDRLYADISYATAVTCLARNKANTIRPTNFVLSNLDARSLVSPDQFRTNLIDTGATAVYTNFCSTTNLFNGATAATNLTIYILSSTNSATNIEVLAIYESDWVTITNFPAGTNSTYATVRRYYGESLTDYYHVFYPGKTNNATNRPAAAFFTKSSMTNGNTNYCKAENRPFYFVWWPDPSWVPYSATSELASKYPDETNVSGARSNYWKQAGTTSFFFVLPAFPSL